jgi:hypothetical protein
MPKYTINIDDTVDRVLEELGGVDPKQKGEIIQKALASYLYLKKASRDNNQNVSITDDNQNVLKNVELP